MGERVFGRARETIGYTGACKMRRPGLGRGARMEGEIEIEFSQCEMNLMIGERIALAASTVQSTSRPCTWVSLSPCRD